MHQRLIAFLAAATLAASSAFASGFQVAAQGARAMGMGLAYTAVADDATAIFFNPGGLALQGNGEILFGAMAAGNTEGTFDSARGTEEQRTGLSALPELHAFGTFGSAKYGVGVFTPFGLPMRWENPATFSGRYTSYTAILKTITVNPTVAWKIGSNLGIGLGADVMYSKIQLERFVPASATIPVNVAQAKINGDLFDNHGYGWNAGVLWTSGPLRLGASYRSSIDIDHDATTQFTVLVPGVPLPTTPLDTAVDIEYPSSLNLGAALRVGSITFSADADRTDWSSFDQLEIIVTGLPPQTPRPNNWGDTWAYRAGIEFPCGPITCRAGYFQDQTPQPLADVGPILPDADRTGYAFGIGWQGAHWGLDVADNYVRFDDRTTTATGTAAGTDRLAGTWRTTGNELAVNANYHW